MRGGPAYPPDRFELVSLLELCFGDVDDDEGLADLRDQLEAYPTRRAPFVAQLDRVIARGDPDECRAILEEWVHLTVADDAQAVGWFTWLRGELGSP